LSWTGKTDSLIVTPTREYEWVAKDDVRVTEIKNLIHRETYAYASESSDVTEVTDNNMLIVGDSSDALRSLISHPDYAKKYRGKVKLVYIDPPFNTGQTFAQYHDGLEHSVWMTMMRDRLVQVRDLLAEDGSVWVHLDDAEMAYCKVIMDEIFGRQNFVSTIVWQKTYVVPNDSKGMSTDQDYIIVFAKNRNLWKVNKLARTVSQDSLYGTIDGDPLSWTSGPANAPGSKTHPGMVYAIQSPFTGEIYYPPAGRHWAMEQTRLKTALEQWGVEYELRDMHDEAERGRLCGLAPNEARFGVRGVMVKGSLEEAKIKAEMRLEQGIWPGVIFGKTGQTGPRFKSYMTDGRTPQKQR
jgi:hypothetical protein